MGASFAERQGPYRGFDWRCSTYFGSARRCAGWLPTEQSGPGNVSARSGIPETAGDDLRCLAQGGYFPSAGRPEPWNHSSRRGARRHRRLTDRDGRRLWITGKECSGSQSDESRDQKHRGLGRIPARAGQPEERFIASVSQGAVWHCYIPTGSYAKATPRWKTFSNYIINKENEP